MTYTTEPVLQEELNKIVDHIVTESACEPDGERLWITESDQLEKILREILPQYLLQAYSAGKRGYCIESDLCRRTLDDTPFCIDCNAPIRPKSPLFPKGKGKCPICKEKYLNLSLHTRLKHYIKDPAKRRKALEDLISHTEMSAWEGVEKYRKSHGGQLPPTQETGVEQTDLVRTMKQDDVRESTLTVE